MKTRAFTLIELLIVVAILIVLATLGGINYLEAQARGKTARVHSEIRMLAGALAAYHSDNGAYPPAALGDLQLDHPLVALTSPVAYVSSIPRDPFGIAPMDFNPGLFLVGYAYKDRVSTSRGMPAETYGNIWKELPEKDYFLHSCGPNRVWDVTPFVEYDPTNGTLSRGDICRFGPM